MDTLEFADSVMDADESQDESQDGLDADDSPNYIPNPNDSGYSGYNTTKYNRFIKSVMACGMSNRYGAKLANDLYMDWVDLGLIQFDEGHLNDSINVDFYNAANFVKFLHELDKKKSYYVYCRSGKRSLAACEIMTELGFSSVFNLESGYLGWIENGYEIVR